MKGYGRTALLMALCLVILALSACSSETASGSQSTPAAVSPTSVQNTPVSATGTADQPSATVPATAPAAATASATAPAVASATTAGVAAATTTAVTSATTAGVASATTAVVAAATKQIPQTSNPAQVPTDTVSAFPDPAGFTWSSVVSGLTKPLDFANPPGDPNRFLILEQPGRIRVVQNGSLLPAPFLDITQRVGSSGNEQGLLGIALHPDFAKNGYFYVNYTDTNGDTVIARYNVSANDPNQADPNSEKVLLRVDQPYPNHNGGSMVFGPDGYLYMGLGDGGSGGDPHNNAQNVNTLLGKVLRVDVNSGDPYAIPSDNPFASGGGKGEIWAYGLRNPWRFSFDRLTGDVYIADVGQNNWEEIDFYPAGSPGGANFGWSYREGTHAYKGNPPADLKLIDPVFEFPHGPECSVTGGFVYRGQALPEFRGVYLFSDFCSGKVWGLLRGADGSSQTKVLFDTGYNVTSFGQDQNGEVYLIDQSSGSVFRLQRK